MKYLKIFVEFADYIEPLEDAERGRLFAAMLRYARDGETPELPGNERFLWPVARQQLDRMSEQYRKVCAANTANAQRKPQPEPEPDPAPEQTALPQPETAPEEKEPAPERPRREAAPKAESRPFPTPSPAPAALLPLAGGGEYPVFAAKAAEWAEKFPGADVPGELEKMRAWLLDHPDRRKGKRDIVPFVLRWLEKAAKRGCPPTPAGGGFSGADLEELYRVMLQNSEG